MKWLTVVVLSMSLWSCDKKKQNNTRACDVTACSAGMLVKNAKIYTSNDAMPFASAMWIEEGVVKHIGDGSGFPKQRPDTITFDAGGARILPGLHDVHQHTLEANLSLIDCTLDPSIEDAERYIHTVRDCAPSSGTGWILGWGYAVETLLGAKRAPRDILDDATRGVPAAIMGETSHSTWVNSAALEQLGIDGDTSNPPGGVIVKDDSGEPTGLLLDAAGEFAWNHALRPSPTLDAANDRALRQGFALNNEVGITSAVDARVYVGRGYVEAYGRAAKRNEVTVRMVLSLWASPVADDTLQLRRLADLYRDEPGFVRITQVKYYSDGLLQNTTAALIEPYTIRDTLAGERGLSYFPEERLARYISELGEVGFDAHIHAIGDRAVFESLNAVESSLALRRRHRLTHVEMVRPADVRRFVELNVGVDMQLGPHTHPDAHSETAIYIGPTRTQERAWVLRSLWDSGAYVALSSDFDVGELSPFLGMEASLVRGAQSLPNIEAAIKAYTINAAWIMRSERQTGSLEVGKEADFIVLEQDIFNIPVDDISETRVTHTFLRGKEVYRRR